MFRGSNYFVSQVRDGQGVKEFIVNRELGELIESDPDSEVRVYKYDVYTYYYFVPKNLKKEFDAFLIECFYTD